MDSFKYARLSRTVHIGGTDKDGKEDECHVAPIQKHKKEAIVSTKIKAKKRKVDVKQGDDASKTTKIQEEADENPLALLGSYDSDSD